MARLVLGKVRPANKGEWNPEQDYTYYDMVQYNEQTWLAIALSVTDKEITPDKSTSWILFGAKGDQGIQGEKGDPFTYEDLTEEQKKEITPTFTADAEKIEIDQEASIDVIEIDKGYNLHFKLPVFIPEFDPPLVDVFEQALA